MSPLNSGKGDPSFPSLHHLHAPANARALANDDIAGVLALDVANDVDSDSFESRSALHLDRSLNLRALEYARRTLRNLHVVEGPSADRSATDPLFT